MHRFSAQNSMELAKAVYDILYYNLEHYESSIHMAVRYRA